MSVWIKKGEENMKVSRVIGIFLGLAIIISAITLLALRGNSKNSSFNYNVKVLEWNNVYEGNNIHFYFNNSDPSYTNFKNLYGLEKVTSNAQNDMEKTLAVINWLNKRAKINISAMESKKTTEQIISGLETNPVLSQKDYYIVLEDLLTSVGVFCRQGYFEATNTSDDNKSNQYNVIEIWSRLHGKWILIDGTLKDYIMMDNIPISAVELMNSDFNKLTFNDVTDSKAQKKYFKNISQYLTAYSVKINNDKFDETKSNSIITYVKDKKNIQLESAKGYSQPTIFSIDEKLFQVNPEIVYHNDNSDKVPTIIVAKRNIKEDTEEYSKFTIGAFLNSVMVDNYYLSINGGAYNQVRLYYDLSLPKGSTTISLSLDGKNELRRVVLEKK